MTKERINLAAPCGIDCGVCELNMSKDNPQLIDVLVSMGIPRKKFPAMAAAAYRAIARLYKANAKHINVSQKKKQRSVLNVMNSPV